MSRLPSDTLFLSVFGLGATSATYARESINAYVYSLHTYTMYKFHNMMHNYTTTRKRDFARKYYLPAP